MWIVELLSKASLNIHGYQSVLKKELKLSRSNLVACDPGPYEILGGFEVNEANNEDNFAHFPLRWSFLCVMLMSGYEAHFQCCGHPPPSYSTWLGSGRKRCSDRSAVGQWPRTKKIHREHKKTMITVADNHELLDVCASTKKTGCSQATISRTVWKLFTSLFVCLLSCFNWGFGRRRSTRTENRIWG